MDAEAALEAYAQSASSFKVRAQTRSRRSLVAFSEGGVDDGAKRASFKATKRRMSRKKSIAAGEVIRHDVTILLKLIKDLSSKIKLKSNDLWDAARGKPLTSSPTSRRRASLTANEDDFSAARKVLKLDPKHRSDKDIRSLWSFCTKNIKFFGRLNEDQGMSLCSKMKLVKLYPYDILFRQGALGDSFYILLFGEVDVYMISAKEIGGLGRKGSLLSMDMLSDSDVRSAWKQARHALTLSLSTLRDFAASINEESGNQDELTQGYQNGALDACDELEDWSSISAEFTSGNATLRCSDIARRAITLCRSLNDLKVCDTFQDEDSLGMASETSFLRIAILRAEWDSVISTIIACVQATCHMIPLFCQLSLEQLGKKITTLKPGSGFGELALMNEGATRNASIAASRTTQFTEIAVIDRDMYNTALKNLHTSKLEAKLKFLSSLPYFKGWKKNHLTKMAYTMTERKFTFNQTIVRAGDPCESMFIIVSGEVKLKKSVALTTSAGKSGWDSSSRRTTAVAPDRNRNRASFASRRSSNVAFAKGGRLSLVISSKAVSSKPVVDMDIGIVVSGDVIGHEIIEETESRHNLSAISCSMVTALEITKRDAERWLKSNAACVAAMGASSNQRQSLLSRRMTALLPPSASVIQQGTMEAIGEDAPEQASDAACVSQKIHKTSRRTIKPKSSQDEKSLPRPGDIDASNIDSVLLHLLEKESSPRKPLGAKRAQRSPRLKKNGRLVEEAHAMYLRIAAERQRTMTVMATPNDLRRLRAENNRLLKRYCKRAKFVSKYDSNPHVIADSVPAEAFHPHTLRKLQTQRSTYRKKWLPYTERHRDMLARRAAEREKLKPKKVVVSGGHEVTKGQNTLRLC